MDSTLELEIIERLKQKFSDCGIDFEKFSNLLIVNNAFLSGSFLLQIIQNRFFDDIDSDIDIYTYGNKNKNLEKGIRKLINNAILEKINVDDKTKLDRLKIANCDPFNGYTKYKRINFINEKSDEKTTKKDSTLSDDELSDDSYVEYELSDDELFTWRTACSPVSTPNEPELLEKKDSDDKETKNIEIGELKQEVKIINGYKGIVRCERREFLARLYDYTKITEIVDFKIAQNLLCKYQLIYLDKELFKTPHDIIDKFDFDFCANYFDGKNIFIKNYNSINTASCILNLSQPRIYKNQNKRIIKYMKRGYNINVRFNNEDYTILYLHTEKTLNISSDDFNISPDVKNLIILCENSHININQVMRNLPQELERIIIYTYPYTSLIDNLPFTIKELRLYIWSHHSGIENLAGSTNPTFYDAEQHKYNQEYCKQHKLQIKKAIGNIKKTPFDCKIYINDELVNI